MQVEGNLFNGVVLLFSSGYGIWDCNEMDKSSENRSNWGEVHGCWSEHSHVQYGKRPRYIWGMLLFSKSKEVNIHLLLRFFDHVHWRTCSSMLDVYIFCKQNLQQSKWEGHYYCIHWVSNIYAFSQLKDFVLNQAEAYEMKIGDQVFRRPGDPPLEELVAELHNEKSKLDNTSPPKKDDFKEEL